MTASLDAAAEARSRAEVATANASRSLQQLCKHFAHRCPVAFDAAEGQVTLPMGLCRLQAAGERLTLSLAAADPAQLAQLEDVVASHLLRFAFREDLQIGWVRS